VDLGRIIMKALILAAGYATRLYPLTKEYPKSLLPVGGRPIIDYIIDNLENIEDIDEIIVITNSKFISKFRSWAKDRSGKKRISLIDDLTKDDSAKRGAIADMNFAARHKNIKDDLLVIGGDNLFDYDLKNFISFAKANKQHPVIGIYNIKSKLAASKYGVIRVDKNNRLLDFQEKPKNPKSTLVAMCLYYFPKQKLRLIKQYLDNKRDKSDATGFYIDWLRRRCPVYAFTFKGRWYDIGHYQFYKEAQEAFANK